LVYAGGFSFKLEEKTDAELRWFYRGTLPKEVSSGFSKINPGHLAPPEREDLYLLT